MGRGELKVIMIFEYCPGKITFYDELLLGGTLFSLIEQRSKLGITDGIDELEILEILGEVSNGILNLHLQDPPISHRDLKVNFLSIITTKVREHSQRM